MFPESIIFDIDGTLWDSREVVAEGYNRQLHAEGLDHLFVTKERLLSLFGKVMSDIADELFFAFPPEERYALMDRCMKTENGYLAADTRDMGYPGVRETMQALSKNHRLFIVSNSQQGYPELCIRKMGLEDCILAHLCFGDTGTAKGETIRRLMLAQNITDAVYVGDTQGDCDAADAAGIPFIWAAYGFGTVSHYDAKIDRFDQLSALFPNPNDNGKVFPANRCL